MMLYTLVNEYNWEYGTHPAMVLPNVVTVEWLKSVGHSVVHANDFEVWLRDSNVYVTAARNSNSTYIGSMYGAVVSFSQAVLKVLHRTGMYSSKEDYYQLCANLNALAPELEATFVNYIVREHTSLLSPIGDFGMQRLGIFLFF